MVAALTGGGQREDMAYATMANRILEAQNKQAMLDQRVMESNLMKDQMLERGNYRRNSMDMDPLVRMAVLAGMAGEHKTGLEAVGVGQKNNLRERGTGYLDQMEAGGADLTDMLNATTANRSDKLLTSSHVQVQPQATADIGVSNAQAKDYKTQAIWNMARAAAEGATGPGGVPIPDVESLTKDQQGLLWSEQTPPETLPVRLGEEWFRGGPDRVENLPFDDARAQEMWLAMEPEERDALMKSEFYGPEFARWRSAQLSANPNLSESDIAIGEFLNMKLGGGANKPSRQELYAPGVSVSPPIGAINELRTNPALADQFDAKFGKGAAAEFLQ